MGLTAVKISFFDIFSTGNVGSPDMVDVLGKVAG